MTVSVQVPYTVAVANGLTTIFPYHFKLLSADDLLVTLNGVEQVTGFTVSGIGDETGGDVTFTVAPASGVTVGLERDPVLNRVTDYQQFGELVADVLNSDIDRVWLALQYLKQLNSTAIKLPYSTAADQTLDKTAAERANALLSFDEAGNVTIIGIDAIPTTVVSGSFTVDTFSGTGSQTIYTLSRDPGVIGNTLVFVDGVYVNSADYTVSGTTLTFDTAPALGVGNIQVRQSVALTANVPADLSVSYNSLNALLRKRHDAVVYVEDFADNTTPGTTDMRAAWNAAIAAVPASGGKVRCRTGNDFRLSDVVALKPGVQIELDGANIIPDANKDAFVLSSGTFPTRRTIVSGGRIAAAATSTGRGVAVDGNFPFIVVSEMEFRNMARGVYLRGAYASKIEDVYAVACGIGVSVNGESHASVLSNVMADSCTIAGAAVNYGGADSWIHNITFIGGAYQGGPVGIWLEKAYEQNVVNPYFEGNTDIDIRVGKADAGVYGRACYNTKVTTFQSNSPCSTGATKVNILVEHSVDVDIDGAGFFNSGPDHHVSVDGYSDRVDVNYWTTACATPWDFPTGVDSNRVSIGKTGRRQLPYDPAGVAGFMEWREANTAVLNARMFLGDGVGGRLSLILESKAANSDVLLRAPATGQIRHTDPSNNDFFTVDILNNQVKTWKAMVLAGQTVGTTVGAAGGASALPATPLGYLTTNINGVTCKIPYYNT